ncbi:MAG: carbohydrate kinase family protein [Chloroflexi bacterium]|nr:carbohydrate kinase family protein [Chloroflexota bacterium]
MTDLDPALEGERPALALGACSIDFVGRLEQALAGGTSNPAEIRTSFGGTARNFAENLARLGLPVTLLSAVGRDQLGRQLVRHAQSAGVNTSQVIETKDFNTGSYLAVVNQQGELQFALDDMRAAAVLTPEYIHERAGLFTGAGLLFVDTNPPAETLAAALALAQEHGVPVAADPTSFSLAPKLKPHLQQLAIVTPNSREAGILLGAEFSNADSQAGVEAAKQLVQRGVGMAIITLAEFGVAYATSEASGHIPAIRTRIIDPTGAGDALTAAVAFARLNDISVDEAVRLGMAAAALTLRHMGAVVPELTLESLYDQLGS